MGISNILLHNQKVKKEIQKEVKSYLEANEKMKALTSAPKQFFEKRLQWQTSIVGKKNPANLTSLKGQKRTSYT